MENLPKELEDRQGRRIVATLGIVVLFLIIGMAITTALTSAPANEPKNEAYLQIDEVFFLLEGTGSDKVTIGVTAFITNIGSEDAENVEIVAFVIEKHSNLALDKNTFSAGSIPKEKTKMAEFSLTMPDGDSYTIKLILMENGKISIRGSGTINLDYHSGGTGTRFATDSKTRGEEDENGLAEIGFGEGASSFPVWFLLGGLLAVILLVTAIRSSASKNKSDDILSYDLISEKEEEHNIFPSGDHSSIMDAQIFEEKSDETLDNLGIQPIGNNEESDL
jgi:hypothetical protein